ncbi:unnamed protein product, partial [Timema podura]|nr:unnamed protein product [Timema podura]
MASHGATWLLNGALPITVQVSATWLLIGAIPITVQVSTTWLLNWALSITVQVSATWLLIGALPITVQVSATWLLIGAFLITVQVSATWLLIGALPITVQVSATWLLNGALPITVQVSATWLLIGLSLSLSSCNSNAKPPSPIKVLLAGSDSFVNSVLRHYVEQLSFKSPDWQNYIRFLIVPLGSNNFLARYLASVDGVYGAAFSVDLWKELLERAEVQKTDCQEMLNRVHRYLHGASATLQLPIAEAMITYKEKSSDDESSQAFVPFIS